VSTVEVPQLSTDPPRPRALPSERVVVGAVRFASRVGDQLLVLGWHGEQTDHSATDSTAGAARIDSRHMALPHPEPVQLGDGRTGVATGYLAAVTTDWPTVPLLVRLGRVSVLVTPDQLFDALVDVRALAWEGLGSIDAEQRKLAAAFLAGVASPPGNARTAGRWLRSCTPCTRRCGSRCRPCRSTPLRLGGCSWTSSTPSTSSPSTCAAGCATPTPR
jgi:hypothetical protein